MSPVALRCHWCSALDGVREVSYFLHSVEDVHTNPLCPDCEATAVAHNARKRCPLCSGKAHRRRPAAMTDVHLPINDLVLLQSSGDFA